jgi:ABC-type Fe3+-hydroxamate transport system substrate-binding protein
VTNLTKTLVLLAAAAVTLAACTGSKEVEPEPNVLPANYKQEILDTLMRVVEDPTNIKDAFVTDPMLMVAPGGRDLRYIVCVKYNPRSGRQYLGSRERLATFFNGHLNQLVETGLEQCAKAAYKPFPELEKLCLARKCD